MDLAVSLQQLGIALGLGLLVGLQRERSASRLAGLRTFPLVTLLGTLCAMLAQSFGGWVLATGLLSLAALIVLGNRVRPSFGAWTVAAAARRAVRHGKTPTPSRGRCSGRANTSGRLAPSTSRPIIFASTT